MHEASTALARELGRLVRDRRIDLGLSQAEVAERCGMKQPQISRFEAGGTIPTLPLLGRLADALGADLTISLTSHDKAA
ncbi:helix-turn-helix transcriptional regulator [Streptomyces sp. SID9124]|uniref:helix-turn-helix domain-containing protein n=1 Tax=Streptomyces sp. SID9124 TaxID=2706108 RepID=UPI0013DF8B3E|nr:helix-turn-helix transcriptional regulator [Streptomyces sp. SID9124]NED14081.1 helix-turn-helix transcriptional regulator [Streptomyces sp. SID9124]